MATLDLPGGGVLNYEVEGRGDPALAFLHGWCSNLRHWDKQVAHFVDRHRVVRTDRRGMGRSASRPAASAGDHADDLVRVLDAGGIQSVVVIGHAGGGPSAVSFAARYPDRVLALVGVDTGIAPKADARRLEENAKFIARLRDDPAYFERRYRTFFGPRADPALVASVVADAAKTPLDVACAELESITSADTETLARGVRAPVLWVTAQPANLEYLKSAFADFTPALAVGSGHYLQLEVPEQLNAMIDTFLRQRLQFQ